MNKIWEKLNNRKSSKRGFTLLYASLVGVLLLAIGAGIFSIIFKELTLSASSRESHFAFYAADSGLECALYWDLNEATFATSSQSVPPSSGVNCNNIDIAQDWTITSDANSAETIFSLSFPPENYCATVKVIKDSSSGTTIESRGYNTCDTSNTRRVERGIRADY